MPEEGSENMPGPETPGVHSAYRLGSENVPDHTIGGQATQPSVREVPLPHQRELPQDPGQAAKTPDIRMQYRPGDTEDGEDGEGDIDRRFIRPERAPYTEMISEGNRWQVMEAVRVTAAGMEEQIVLDFDERPDTYWANIRIGELRERRRSLGFTFPRWPNLLSEAGKEKQDLIRDPVERELLQITVEDGYRELRARTKLAEQLGVQEAFSGDIGQYLDAQFKRVSDTIPTKFYEYIFGAKETAEGFVEYGKKVEVALRALSDIGEGNAEIEIDGRRKKLPNIFSMPANRGVQDIVMNHYILPKLQALRNLTKLSEDEKWEKWKEQMNHIKSEEVTEVMNELQDWDDRSAVITAIAIFRHWDLDVKYSIGRKGSGAAFDVDQIPPDEWGQIERETGAASKDSAKLDIEVRRASEWGRKRKSNGKFERREHVRPVGNPITFGVYPRMIITVPEVIVTQIPVDETIRQQVIDTVGSDNFSFEGTGSSNKIELTVQQYAIDKQAKVLVRVNGEVEPRSINLNFPEASMANVGWDDAQIIGVDTNGEYLEIAAGPQSDAFHVPYQLAGMYLYKMYEQIMRTDYLKQYQEAIRVGDTNLLLSLNKPIDNGLFFLSRKYGIRKSTIDKLNNLIRANFLGGMMAQVEPLNSHQFQIERTQLSEHSEGGDYTSHAERRIIEAARVHSFLPLDEDGEDFTGPWLTIAKTVGKNRKGYKPSEIKINGQPLFTEGELAELKPMYPLGI